MNQTSQQAAAYSAAQNPKPRLLFFQWDHSPYRGLSNYFMQHMNDHVRCLSVHFDVTVVNQDCDYAEVCDRHCPDLVLFESGYQTFVSRRPRITNITDNGIHRVGLHNADAWSNCRSGFLSDMEHYRIDTFFSISTTTHEYMSDISKQMYIWPNFIDPAVFRDYGNPKIVPVMICGQSHESYPWRAKVYPLLGQLYPSIVCPTFHSGSGLANRTLAGEGYARALNASWFSPACGTVAGEVVRKHFEIPGSRTCLVTQESEALKQAGFVHMQNCVFAEPDDVVAAMDSLLCDHNELEWITENGFRLVHSRHTIAHRPQIHQWFTLRRNLRHGERIVQDGPFGDLSVTGAASAPPIAPFVSRGVQTSILRRANASLLDGRLEEAARDFEECLRSVKYLPEARFGLALCALMEGAPDRAGAILAGMIEHTVAAYGAADPDPIEWVYFVVSVLAQGDLEKAHALERWYPALAHQERRHLVRVIRRLRGEDDVEEPVTRPDRPSIHSIPSRSFDEWSAWLAIVLRRSGQLERARRLAADDANCPDRVARAGGGRRRWRRLLRAAVDLTLRIPGIERLSPTLPPATDFHFLHCMALVSKRRLTRLALVERLRMKWRRMRSRREADCLRRAAFAQGVATNKAGE